MGFALWLVLIARSIWLPYRDWAVVVDGEFISDSLSGGFLHGVGNEFAAGPGYGARESAFDQYPYQVGAEFGWTTHVGYGGGDGLSSFGGLGDGTIGNLFAYQVIARFAGKERGGAYGAEGDPDSFEFLAAIGQYNV